MEKLEGSLAISLDKLPLRRIDAIEDNGVEHFPPNEIGHDEKQISLVRRIDFTPIVEKDTKKKKESTTVSQPWPWQSLVENLQLAHQELSVIIDLINTVETNDAVAVIGMTRPKQLPSEVLADFSVSVATKLQCFRHLGKYFKQSSKTLEQQVAREARFYGALIRLQQNWKVKRQRSGVPILGSEGFTIDLFDNSLSDPSSLTRPPAISVVRIDHDSSGMLKVCVPPKSCRYICLDFSAEDADCEQQKVGIRKGSNALQEDKREVLNDEDVDNCVKESHAVLREIHQAIFEEQIFDLVNREAFKSSLGVNVTRLSENFLQLGIGQEFSLYLSLVPSVQDNDQVYGTLDPIPTGRSDISSSDSYASTKVSEEKHHHLKKGLPDFPNPISYKIYLQQILLENIFSNGKDKDRNTATRSQVSNSIATEGYNFLGHFCMSLAHRIFSNKVLREMENLVNRVPYLHLLSLPTWQARTSSWSLSMKVPESLHASRGKRTSDIHDMKNHGRFQFNTKVVVNDESITIGGEGGPNIVGLFHGNSIDFCPSNSYNCGLADLPMILLQQVASQVIYWLHEEALRVGMKANKDFLCLSIELYDGSVLGLVAHVDPFDIQGCISWWLVMHDGVMDDSMDDDYYSGESENRRFLGYLSLQTLYSTLMDLISLCTSELITI